MSKVEELLKDNKLAEKLSMAKLNDLLKKRRGRQEAFQGCYHICPSLVY